MGGKGMKIIYLLSGNGSMASWWQYCLPYFTSFKPVPLELPGFGDNQRVPCKSLDCLANAVIEQTAPGQVIVACGVNGLPVLHAAVKKPDHFKRIILYGPIGAFLWKRSLPRWLAGFFTQTTAQWLLSRFPGLFEKRFCTTAWTQEQWNLIALGYRQCKAFKPYFDLVKPHNALTLFDTIKTEILLLWGLKDSIADPQHAAAWEAILPRARLGVTLKPHWGHYPYLEHPEEFAHLLEQEHKGFAAHTKAGRLHLARLAGLEVPEFAVVTADHMDSLQDLVLDANSLWAVRSSQDNEDRITQSNAGQSVTYLHVPAEQVLDRAIALSANGAEVILQRFIQPKVSGVAFVRPLSAEIEWVPGHLNSLVQGQETPQRAVLSKLGGPWQDLANDLSTYGMDLIACWRFLQSVVDTFHQAHLDIEWAWDGERFYLFQLRPVTEYTWRRSLTGANISEILPASPSRLVEHIQRQASFSIPRIYALWDKNVLQDNEPFTCTYDNASYINTDAFLARLHQWGLPGKWYTQMIGGTAPELKMNVIRFINSVPVFIQMSRTSRRTLLSVYRQLDVYSAELDTVLAGAGDSRREKLINWFLRFYVFVVQTNMVINAAIATSLGNWFNRPVTAYRVFSKKVSNHRVMYETDPASPREPGTVEKFKPPEPAGWLDHWLDYLGLPGNANRYIELREWFRDSYTRLYHKLHFGLLEYELDDPRWFEHHAHPRRMKSGFWQHSGDTNTGMETSVIYPGVVKGKVGEDILIVDTLDPGQYRIYQTFKAVIARMGGQLSHGAILLRELRIPSAVIPDLPEILDGAVICLNKDKVAMGGKVSC